MTTTLTPTSAPTTSRPRPPAAAVTAALLTLLASAMGAYGAIYFIGLEGWDDLGITFVTTYEYIALTGLVSGVALFRGSRLGWVGVLWYAAFQVAFTACKLLTIQEVEAIPFGVVGVVLLVLATRPSVRAYASR